MPIGVMIQPNNRGELITDAVARGATVMTSIQAAMNVNAPVLQGDNKAVAAMGDSVTGRLAPPIPGGAQFAKLVLVLPTVPVRGDPKQWVLGPNKVV